MKKIILQTTAILLILAGVVACGKENENNEINTLKGTKWKLAGIVDTETGVLKELEPKDCEQCYTLDFDTDTTAHGQSSSNDIIINISKMPPTIGGTKRNESGDGHLYMDLWYDVNSYNREDNKLKFFYEKDSYLLFKKI
ncbi:MAG: hypothetical protein LBP63_05860 [Prevotellaceae bacterium]|jgi:hypothetical protein|nr:hypothetical protein [Prevotellaceae bacterium]